MAAVDNKKEALFNEVKGSLFEYLVAKRLALLAGEELDFHRSLDPNYLTVLSQQDRMVRQFYPEMLPFLNEVSQVTADRLVEFFGELPHVPKVMGKFVSTHREELDEADLLVTLKDRVVPVSLKLNKRNAFVNTKSAGIRSFFSQYFPFLPLAVQERFNRLVDLEFLRMASELHDHHELEFPGDFSRWVREGLSELPGELAAADRSVLKAYYARIAQEMHHILTQAQLEGKEKFWQALTPLMGFGRPEILQVVCFHEFRQNLAPKVEIHPFEEVHSQLAVARILPFAGTSSVEIEVGSWALQVRVKPMNKFTTTAVKINCSVKVKS